MSMPAFNQKLNLINKMLEYQEYTIVARECLSWIEGGLREILINDTDKLAEEDKKKVRDQEDSFTKGSRAKSFKDFTLGQLVGVIRESNFFEAWAKVSHRQLPDLIDLNKLNKLRIELFHAEGWTTQRETTKQEADLLLSLLKSFDEVLQLGANPLLLHLRQEIQRSSLKPLFRQKVVGYLKAIENKGMDDTAVERIQVIEEFISNQCSANDFEEFWQDQQNTALNYATLLEQLRHGEIALFLGSEIPEKIKNGLEQEQNHEALPLTELCELIELQHGRTTLYRKIEHHANALLLTENFHELAELLAGTPKPIILISVDCNSLIQEVFKRHHKPFVVFSPAIDSKYLGKFIVEYWDKPELQVVTTEELSDLRLFERDYSLIYKIRGCFSLNNDKLAVTKDKDCLILSEQDYFTFARHLDRLVPDYLAGLLQTRGLWFLGHHPDNWQNRLLMQAILEKRPKSLVYSVDAQINEFTNIYWKARGVENYQVSLNEFVRNLQQA